MTNNVNQNRNGEIEERERERERENVYYKLHKMDIFTFELLHKKRYITFESHIVIFIGNVRKEKEKLEVEMEKETLGGKKEKREIMNVVVENMKLCSAKVLGNSYQKWFSFSEDFR